MNRRDFLRSVGYRTAQFSATAWVGRTLFSGFNFPLAYGGAQGMTAASMEALKSVVGSSAYVLTTADPRYANHAASFNRTYESIKPQMIALCLTAEAVRETVQWAVTHGVEIRVRSGGHCYENFSIGRELLIDLSQMNKISCDPPSGFARIQPGARLGQVYQTLIARGLILPAGSCPTVGVAGLTLGGGHGLFSRKWGLTCDHLQSVQMVIVDTDQNQIPQARIVQASAEENPDLFWACRGGGGGSFGVVTEFMFKAHPIEAVTRFNLAWHVADAHDVVSRWQEWGPETDDRLATTLHVNVVDGQLSAVTCSGIFVGPMAELKLLAKPMLETGTLVRQAFVPTTMSEAVIHYAGGGDSNPIFFKASSDYAYEPLSSEGIMALLSSAKTLLSGGGAVMMDAYGGAINQVGVADTAFFHRTAKFCVQYYVEWSTAAQGADRIAWVERMRHSMAGHFSGHCYVNYCDLGVTNYQAAYFGTNSARLSQIKKKADPHNFFKFAQSVVPSAS